MSKYTEAEFERLVEEQKATIYTVCYMFSKDESEVADLFQETLINLWRGLDSFRHDSAIRTWVWRVALNTCITAERKNKKRREAERLNISIDLWQESDTDAETSQIRKLHNRIQSLGLFDRAIVLMWLEGFSYQEIGAIVGITEKNVSVRLYRIKEALKKMNDNDQ